MARHLDIPSFEELLKGGKAALARALAAVEAAPDDPRTVALLDAAWDAPRATVAGLTGPPGVGKSTLTNALVSEWRKRGKTVGIIAVDPSSRRTHGALLGDRTRMVTDPADQGVFIRSMAARDRLGGLADLTFPALVLMRAVFDVVLVETVGIGQSETDIADVADTVVFCIQPGSGDSLQFMKAGIMEVPDIALVTKADMGPAASRAVADVRGALGLSEAPSTGWQVKVLTVSAAKGEGVAGLVDEIEAHGDHLFTDGALSGKRRDQGLSWVGSSLGGRFGREGLSLVAEEISADAQRSPFALHADLSARLQRKWRDGIH
ncbi:LAO/AO transport system kinase [Parvibaculum indicum]|uniref:methylmalonyl Co-A mutase-associated GTPase MeaB n=1 Tax=Parvibaculum indicum TaxID=562969 RepID=UPI00141F4FD6|nr:LAO/AO transport system kinase [Parvibaculum indicum]